MKRWMADIFTGLLVVHRMEIIGCAFWHDDSEGERLDRSSHKRLQLKTGPLCRKLREAEAELQKAAAERSRICNEPAGADEEQQPQEADAGAQEGDAAAARSGDAPGQATSQATSAQGVSLVPSPGVCYLSVSAMC